MSYHDTHIPISDPRLSPHSPPGSPGAATPTSTSAGSTSFLSGSFYNAIGGLMRRLSAEPSSPSSSYYTPDLGSTSRSLDTASSGWHPHSHAHPHPFPHQQLPYPHRPSRQTNDGIDGVYTPPHIARAASPLQPPPLDPLRLTGYDEDTPVSARLLTTTVAEEIRIMIPERLRIEEEWKLAYSLDQDGASLATLYEKCANFAEFRSGFVLVIKDQEGATFGAYLTEYPHPSPHYFGTGECFLWRASLLASLPPPPSADTSNLTARNTTIAAAPATPTYPASTSGAAASYYSEARASESADSHPFVPLISAPPPGRAPSSTTTTASASARSTSSPAASRPSSSAMSPLSSPTPLLLSPHMTPGPSLRFSAFPYSGVNEYFIYCEAHSLSVGGGDGKYGLWLDDSLERGISATCMTFGNQPLSDEGDKFGVLGVEVWVIGSRR